MLETFLVAGGHEAADDVVGGAEGDVFVHEVFGHHGGVGEAFIEALGDTFRLQRGVQDDGRGHGEARLHLIVREEDEARLVLLLHGRGCRRGAGLSSW